MGTENQPLQPIHISHTSQQHAEIPVATMRRELEQQRQASRRLLNDLASAIYKNASHVTSRASGAVASAARRTGHAAQYVQDQYLREMLTGLGRFVRRHPAPSVAAAIIAGLVAGRALRHR